MATDKKVIRATRTDMEPFLDNMAWSFYLAIRSNATQRGRFNIFSGKTCQTHSYPRTPTPTNLSSTMPAKEVMRLFLQEPPGTYRFASDNGKKIHFLVSHPTPPVFDGPEDRNGRRNHDEIRLWADYVSADKSHYSAR